MHGRMGRSQSMGHGGHGGMGGDMDEEEEEAYIAMQMVGMIPRVAPPSAQQAALAFARRMQNQGQG